MEKSFDFGALLKNHEKKHKNKPTQFVSVAGGVKKRLENSQKYRKSNRLSIFDSIRNLTKSEILPPVSETQQKAEHRRQQLEKWKAEKEKRKKEMEAQKKKPFIAGVAHAPLKFIPPPAVPKPMPSSSGRVTRSQTAKTNIKQKVEPKEKINQSFAPKNATFRPPQNLVKAPNLIPAKVKKDKNIITFEPVIHKANAPVQKKENVKEIRSKSAKQVPTERVTRSKQIEQHITKGKVAKPNQKQQKSPLKSSSSSELDQISQSPIMPIKKGRKSLPAPNSPNIKNKTSRKSIGVIKEFTPQKPVPKSESSSEERLRSPKNADVVFKSPEHSDDARISPYITMSRGKDNARREMKEKLDEGLLDEDASDIESVDHFRRQLASEIKRMTEMCDTWDKISEQTQLPDAVQECVLTAVGQARLLMSQKMMQFSSLVERCAKPEGGALVTPADLHGFWDMVFMQVENVDMRFKKLEELRSRGWVEDQPAETMKKVVKQAVKKAKPAAGPSRLREMIAAARKAKKEQEQQESQPPAQPTPPVAGDESKTFEAGFFCVKSPVRSPVRNRTPNKPNLLKAVLSSEAKKASTSKNSASFAMLRASVMGRNVDVDGVAPLPQSPLTPVNINATPGRSILKSANLKAEKSGRKSIKVVLFDQSESDVNTSLTDETEKNVSFEQHSEEKSPEDVSLKKQHTDSGLSSMDVEKDVENKENSRRKSKLMRQDATEERSPVVTRSRRKSMNTPHVESSVESKPKRSGRKKALQEMDNIEEKLNQTPKRSSRRRKSNVNAVMV